MPTRSGRTFSVGETSALMDPSIHDTLNTILKKIENMDRQLQEVRDQVDVNCRDLGTRIGRLETDRRRIKEEESSEMTVGLPGVSKAHLTIQPTPMPSISGALKSMLCPSTGAWTLRFI